MSVLAAAAAHLAAIGAHAAASVPNPPPTPPPGLTVPANTIIAWFKWGARVAGVLGLIMCAIMMMIGRKSRHSYAADGATGVPWVLGGLTLVAIAAAVVGQFV